MQKIEELVIQNFELNDTEKQLLKSVLKNGLKDTERVYKIVKSLLEFRLDFHSIIAYLAYESGFVFDEYVDSDILKIYSTLKSAFVITEGMSKQEQADVIRKMFIAMSNDVRVIVIRLYIMLYDISNYKLPLTKEQKQFLINVKDIYAPLAERLGLNSLKSNLEDYCLKLLNPKTYENLSKSVMLQRDTNEEQIKITKNKLQQILDELGLKDAVIMARQKHFSSIYRKIKTKGESLANIYDLIALRVLVDTVDQCYAVLGKIHAIYKPMEGRIKDYIALPKPNGYQSLHTTIIAENKRPLEIQIRTFEMHKLAEFGVFAHWLYKEKKSGLKSELDKKISWLREIMESSKDLSSEEFIDTLKTNLCEGQIYVQTPKGKVLEFVEGATALDFAYAIHSDVGNFCVGAKINGKIKPLGTKLQNGDIVEVITSQNSKGPSKDWLKIVVTSNAKSKINSYFKHELKEENIKLGLSMLEQGIKNRGFSPSKILVDKYLDMSQFKFAFKTKEELFAAIGYGSVSANNICNKLCQLYQADNPHDNELQSLKSQSTNALLIKKNKDGVLVDGDSGMLIRYAGCCSPVYGEEIIGYISRARGVTVHRVDCPNLKYLEPERLINAVWDDSATNKTTSAVIKIISSTSDGFLAKLTQEILGAGYKILGLESKVLGDKTHTTLKTEVKKLEDITKIINTIKLIGGVDEVFRAGN